MLFLLLAGVPDVRRDTPPGGVNGGHLENGFASEDAVMAVEAM